MRRLVILGGSDAGISAARTGWVLHPVGTCACPCFHLHEVGSCHFTGVFTMNSLLPEELIHEWSHLLSLGEEQQVSPVDNVEPRMWNQARHDPGIDWGDDWVVVAGQDQGRLRELMQPGQAGPAHACQQLPVVPETGRRSDQVRIRASEVGPLAEHAAIEGRGYGDQV